MEPDAFTLEVRCLGEHGKMLGEYPAEYNRAVHGPYHPMRYYGKPDTPFGQVKLKDLASWIARRKKTPTAFVQALSRAWFTWDHKFMQPKNPGLAPFIQVAAVLCAWHYTQAYRKYRTHR